MEVVSRYLVTFKTWDGVNDKIFSYYRSSLKNQGFFWGGGVGKVVHEKNMWGDGGVNRLKMGGLV